MSFLSDVFAHMLLLRSEPGTIMLRVNGLSQNAPWEHAVVLKLFRCRDCFFPVQGDGKAGAYSQLPEGESLITWTGIGVTPKCNPLHYRWLAPSDEKLNGSVNDRQ